MFRGFYLPSLHSVSLCALVYFFIFEIEEAKWFLKHHIILFGCWIRKHFWELIFFFHHDSISNGLVIIAVIRLYNREVKKIYLHLLFYFIKMMIFYRPLEAQPAGCNLGNLKFHGLSKFIKTRNKVACFQNCEASRGGNWFPLFRG